jgi:N-acetylmuramoyl-L-alanine amidase
MRANDLKNRCSKLAVTIVFFKAIIFATAGGMPLFVASAFAAPTSIESVRVRQSPERTRIVFDLSQPVKHRIFSLANPRRLVIDIEETDLAVDISDVLIEGTPITG